MGETGVAKGERRGPEPLVERHVVIDVPRLVGALEQVQEEIQATLGMFRMDASGKLKPRDVFAAHAAAGIIAAMSQPGGLSIGSGNIDSPYDVANVAYQIAEQMLECKRTADAADAKKGKP